MTAVHALAPGARGAPWWLAAFVLLGLAWPRPAAAQADERAVKAAFVYNFIQFTQWPTTPEEPFTLCVLGRSPMDEALSRLEGKAVLDGLHLKLQRLANAKAPLTGCHALYLDDSQRAAAEEMLPRLAGLPILTMSDSDGLADRGLVIEIRRRETKLGFEVNLGAARRANLQLSSRLLKMAAYVGGAR